MQTGGKESKILVAKEILQAEKMTPDELRTYPGFENIDNNEAAHVIETLEMFSLIIVRHMMQKENNEEP